jgi:hypothetical protein
VYVTFSDISSIVELLENIHPDMLTNMKINAIENAWRRLAMVIGSGFNIVTYVLKRVYFSVITWEKIWVMKKGGLFLE